MTVIIQIQSSILITFIYFNQEQVEEMKKKEERMEKQMNEIMAENKRLTEPLQKAREEVEELRKQVRIFKFVVYKINCSTVLSWNWDMFSHEQWSVSKKK